MNKDKDTDGLSEITDEGEALPIITEVDTPFVNTRTPRVRFNTLESALGQRSDLVQLFTTLDDTELSRIAEIITPRVINQMPQMHLKHNEKRKTVTQI